MTRAVSPRSIDRRAGAGNQTGRESLAVQIAREIEGEARANGWASGVNIGSETELIDRYGVSRAILREAVRLVEHSQIATMRRGPNGGLILQSPEVGPAASAAAVYLEYVGATVEDLLDARLILEPQASSLAAQGIEDEGIVRLREMLAGEVADEDESGAERDDRLHLLLAEISGNPALVLFIEILISLTHHYVNVVERSPSEARRWRTLSFRAHSAIAEAVIAGNVGAAEHRTRVHLVALGEWFRQQKPKSPEARRRQVEVHSDKLAEEIARNIRFEIAEEGWQVGAVLGSEAELQERHQVSRSVLREAVRILEHHGVARMRRGPGGGLMVTEPQPVASIDAMASYLDSQDISLTDLRIALTAIELACVDLVAARASDPEVSDQLRDALEALTLQTPGNELAMRSNLLHRRICELAGNPVLILFSDIMTALWSRHSMVPDGDEPNSALATPVTESHGAIVAALSAGDAALARHRMTRHLEAMSEWWH